MVYIVRGDGGSHKGTREARSSPNVLMATVARQTNAAFFCAGDTFRVRGLCTLRCSFKLHLQFLDEYLLLSRVDLELFFELLHVCVVCSLRAQPSSTSQGLAHGCRGMRVQKHTGTGIVGGGGERGSGARVVQGYRGRLPGGRAGQGRAGQGRAGQNKR